MRISDFFKVYHKDIKSIEKILQTWYFTALIFEISAIFSFIVFFETESFKWFGTMMASLVISLALHIMIQIADIQLKLEKPKSGDV